LKREGITFNTSIRRSIYLS